VLASLEPILIYFMQKKAFTLIELLVVISIIGMLSSIVLASLNTARAKARDVRRKSDMGQISKALWLYYDANNRTMPQNTGGGDSCGANYTGAMQILVNQGHLPKIPTDPGSGSYCYHNYGRGNVQGAMIRAIFEQELSTTSGIPPSCRPFNGSNWCRNDSNDKQYCLCHPH